MNDQTTKPQGRSMPELRAIVAADQERWDQLAEIWDSLMPAEQIQLIETARGLVKETP
jgi:hypothetical protein